MGVCHQWLIGNIVKRRVGGPTAGLQLYGTEIQEYRDIDTSMDTEIYRDTGIQGY